MLRKYGMYLKQIVLRNITTYMFKVPADVCENFRNMCFEKHHLEPICFVSAPGLAWQACFK